jgi:hypothetical protein
MNRRSIVARCSIIVAILGLSQAHAQSSTPTLVCDIEVYPSPTGFPSAQSSSNAQQEFAASTGLSGDPCQDGTIVFSGQYERGTGKPEQVISEFILDTDADVCIISQSGAKGKASLFVDGINIAEPEDFDDQTDIHMDSLVAGSHGLGVRAVGKPGGYVEVEVRQLASGGGGGGDPDLPAPGEVRIDPGTGALDMVNADGSVRLQNVASDHPLLTPNGDGHHDTTVLQALTTPLVELPGKDDGSVAYFVNWEFQVVDLATCNTIDTGLSGSKQINSPTLVEAIWNGSDNTGVQLLPGNYAYLFDGNVVDEFGVSLGNITSPGMGLVIDSLVSDYDESAENRYQCQPATDPEGCKCLDSDGEDVPNCAFAFVRYLLPGGTFNFGQTPNYYNPSVLDLSFITTTLDPVSGRYTVTVDLREQNAMGLVPKGLGIWSSEAILRQWVSDMTGVPLSTDDSLFNFDYVQIGTTAGVNLFGRTFHTYNHFLLDAMTNEFGQISVGGVTTDLASEFNNDANAPPRFGVANDSRRAGDECTISGNHDGLNTLRAKFCSYNTAVKIGNETDLGIYTLRGTVFDVNFNDEFSRQDRLCVIDDFYHCGIRTQGVVADTMEIESSYYLDGTDPEFTRTETVELEDVTGASVSVDRAWGEDGVCSRAVAIRDGLAVRMDAADGAVPDSCIINGIF